MKNIFLIFVLFLASCLNIQAVSEKMVFINTKYRMILFFRDNLVVKFELMNLQNKKIISGVPELISIDGEIPEGTNRIDYNDANDSGGYQCDSTYQFISKQVSISFSIEKNSQRRLDLHIFNSVNKYIEDGDFTLQNNIINEK